MILTEGMKHRVIACSGEGIDGARPARAPAIGEPIEGSGRSLDQSRDDPGAFARRQLMEDMIIFGGTETEEKTAAGRAALAGCAEEDPWLHFIERRLRCVTRRGFKIAQHRITSRERDLEGHSLVIRAARRRDAVERIIRSLREYGARQAPIGACELMEHTHRPVGRHLEKDPQIVGASVTCYSVEIAVVGEQEARLRLAAIRAVEGMEQRVSSGGRDLEKSAHAVRPAERGGAVEGAIRSGNERAFGASTHRVRAIKEHRVTAIRRQLEDDSVAVGPAAGGRAVKIRIRSQEQAGVRRGAVCLVEVMQDAVRACRRDRERRAVSGLGRIPAHAIVFSALARQPVKSAVGSFDQFAHRTGAFKFERVEGFKLPARCLAEPPKHRGKSPRQTACEEIQGWRAHPYFWAISANPRTL